MSRDARLAAVEDALRASDDDALAAALKALGASYLWGSLELRAHELLTGGKVGDVDLATKMYVVIVNGKRPSLGAWNNLCWALAAAKNRPDIAIGKSLLERAMAVGPMNVPIFHNVVCAAVKYGLTDLAIEAIAGASKYGYDKMDRLGGDADLVTLADDPRFEAAFSAKIRWTPDELAKLTVVLVNDDVQHVVHRAVMAMTFSFTGAVDRVAPRLAPLLDAYLADLPEGALRVYGRGSFKPLSKGMLTKTRNELLEPREYLRVDLRSTDDACEFEFRVDGDREGVRVELAFPLGEANDPDAFEARFLRYAKLVAANEGHAGYAVRNRDSGTYEGMSWNRKDLVERFAGFRSHWLTWKGDACTRSARLPPIEETTVWDNAPVGWSPTPTTLGAPRVVTPKKKSSKKKSFFEE